MAIPTNYTSLQTAVANWLNRSDLTSNLPEFISYGEARLNRICRLSQQETTAAVTTTLNQNYTSLPTGFLEHISLVYDNDLYEAPTKVDLPILDDIRDRSSGSSSVPDYFAISNSRYEWNYAAGAAYSLTARFWKKWDIVNDATNWLLTNYPDAYIYCSLAHAGQFISHPKTAEWEAKAKEITDELEYQSARLKKATLRCEAPLIIPARSNIFTGN